MTNRIYLSVIKRIIDLFVSIFLLCFLSLVLFAVFVILGSTLRGSPLFTQVRAGRDGRLFKIFKFKTMTDKRDDNGKYLPDEERITSFGNFLRKASIDELPQLLNVARGDMSLVGPRPLLPEYLPLYSDEQRKRHNVRPGITGWAQVNGRNSLAWSEKFKLDVWYVEHLSFLLDVKIILLTIKKVFIREGISSDTSATMERFTGK